VIAVRLNERFHTFAAAFRFFDINFKNQITFNEFSKGLETLKVKVSLKD
jgi:predicted lipoprotein